MDQVISVYHDIKSKFMKMPYYPYLFQNADAGILEASIRIYPNEMKKNRKSALANKLFLYLQDSIELNKPTVELIELLEAVALLNYAEEFMELVRFNASSHDGTIEIYTKVGKTLATMLTHKELIKLGILLLGLEEKDEYHEIIMTLGCHSEYTAYAIEAFRYSMYRNDYVMELLGKTSNYGRVCALSSYVVMDSDSAIYLMEHSYNDRLPCYATYVILDKIVCEEYFDKVSLTKYNYSKYSYLLSHALIDRSLKEFPYVLPLLKKFISNANELATSCIDYCALLVIKESLENGGFEEESNALIEMCTKLLENEECKELAIAALDSFNGKSELLLQMCMYLEIEIPEDNLVNLFKEAMVVVTDYMFLNHLGKYDDVATGILLPMVMSKIMGNGWKDKLDLTKEEYFVHTFLNSTKGKNLDVLVAALNADNRVLRECAIDIILSFENVPKCLWEILEECTSREVDSKVKRKLRKVLKLKNS